MTAANEEPLDDFLVNNVIAGRYKIEDRLAKGGMATVFSALDQTLNRRVALKLLRPQKNTDDPGKLTERFRMEAEALARLNHRHIVTIYDYGETEDGGYFLAMELVDGPSLSTLIRKERLAPERAARVVIQVCKALRYSHKQGIIHRDLKPGNILVTKEEDEEVAKLVDFGLVKLTEEESMTQHGLILGTVHCMAPEQIRGGKIDARTDIYAMGVVLFRLVVGHYPYNSKQTAEVLAAHLHAPIPSFSSFDPNLLVPPGLEDVVRKCLQKNPANRYQSATEMIQDLAECLQVPPEQFVSVSLLVKDVQGLQQSGSTRNILIGGMLGLAGLMLLGGIAAFVVAMTSTGSGTEETPATTVVPPVPEQVVEPEPEPEPEPETPEPEPETEEVEPEPEPEPVAAPKPRPRPRPRPRPKPEPDDGVAEAVAPKPAPKPAPAASYAVELVDVKVAQNGPGNVVVTLKMSNPNVRALGFGAEVAGSVFKKQFVVRFKGGGSGLSTDSVSVGHPLLESVTIHEQSGFLQVLLNSKETPDMKLEGSGPEYRIVVSQ